VHCTSRGRAVNVSSFLFPPGHWPHQCYLCGRSRVWTPAAAWLTLETGSVAALPLGEIEEVKREGKKGSHPVGDESERVRGGGVLAEGPEPRRRVRGRVKVRERREGRGRGGLLPKGGERGRRRREGGTERSLTNWRVREGSRRGGGGGEGGRSG
jgi:hypothetical protein